jgi:ceramide glucosyltransferase
MAVIADVLLALAGLGCLYLVTALLAARAFARRAAPAGAMPPATVLKPLHGADAELAANLASFRDQDYPAHQVVCGVREPADPAAEIARTLGLDLVVDPTVRGTNHKVANLENMLPAARHPVVAIADSDMRVERGYLAAIVPPLGDEAVGLVTCAYRARAVGGVWSALGAMYVNYGFLPAALLNEVLDPGKAVFGATMALRRAVLDEIGGFAVLRDQLADDYALGAAVRRTGRRVVLSHHLVDTIVAEPSLAALLRHELRWARTIRLVAPWGHAGSVVTHPVALALLGALAGGLDMPGLAVLAAALAGRVAFCRALGSRLDLPRVRTWLLPVRDLLSFGVFVTSFCGNRIAWRDQTFTLRRDGRLVLDGDAPR